MQLGVKKRFRILRMLPAIFVISSCLETAGNSDSNVDAGFSGGGTSTSNNAPRISGSPNTAIFIGDNYSFTPAASDADGDALSFSIRNLPGWATFDTNTGSISGQPLRGEIGVYAAIQISVSDTATNSSLPDFSITVTESALGVMTLSWTPPTENTDGTALTDLAGYRLYFGRSQGNYPNQVRIDNPSIRTYVIENLLPATYYVVASSFNALGVESTFSNVAVIEVPSG